MPPRLLALTLLALLSISAAPPTEPPAADPQPLLAYIRDLKGGRPLLKVELDTLVWTDGVMVYRTGMTEGDKSAYAVAHLAKDELDRLTSIIKPLPLFTENPRVTYNVADHGWHEFIMFTTETTPKKQPKLTATVRQWDEIIQRGWGANTKPTPEYIAFAQDWTRLRIVIAGLKYTIDKDATTEANRDRAYRGINFANPRQSPSIADAIRKRK